jgi:putative phage-type endonuclease
MLKKHWGKKVNNKIISITPSSKEDWLKARALDVTSTEVSALFGVNPYMTKFELWHRKNTGDLGSIAINDRMKWGNRLEESIAKGIAEDKGWEIKKKSEYMSLQSERIGASFDFEVLKPEAILEIKNVDYLKFKEGWVSNEDGTGEAPLHIELQVQQQMLVSGLPVVFIGALIGGNDVFTIEREADMEVIKEIRGEVKDFWQSIKEGKSPEPDFRKDAEFIAKIYSSSIKEKVVESSPIIDEIAREYKVVSDRIKELEEIKAGLKAKVLTAIGDAGKVIGNGYSISSGMIGESQVSYTRKGYRDFRILFKKGG